MPRPASWSHAELARRRPLTGKALSVAGEQPQPERQHVGKKNPKKNRNKTFLKTRWRESDSASSLCSPVFVYFILRAARGSAQITGFFFPPLFFSLCRERAKGKSHAFRKAPCHAVINNPAGSKCGLRHGATAICARCFSAFWLDLKKFIEMGAEVPAEGYQTMKRGGEEGGGEKKKKAMRGFDKKKKEKKKRAQDKSQEEP